MALRPGEGAGGCGETDTLLSFATATLAATTQLFLLLLALAMVPLIGGRLQTALVLIDLWLLNELLACLLDRGFRFGTLLAPLLLASALQLAIRLWGADRLALLASRLSQRQCA